MCLRFTDAEAIVKVSRLYVQGDCDCSVMIYNGGNRYEMNACQTVALAKVISDSLIHVILGIGHEEDQFLCDEEALLSCKTPTAAAVKLLQVAGCWLFGNDGQEAKDLRGKNRRDGEIGEKEIERKDLQLKIQKLEAEIRELKTENAQLKPEKSNSLKEQIGRFFQE